MSAGFATRGRLRAALLRLPRRSSGPARERLTSARPSLAGGRPPSAYFLRAEAYEDERRAMEMLVGSLLVGFVAAVSLAIFLVASL